MAVVGSAEIVVRAITNRVKDDIQKAFQNARPQISAEGRQAARVFANSFSDELNKSLGGVMGNAFNNASGAAGGGGRGRDTGRRLAEDIVEGVDETLTPGMDGAGRRGGNALINGLSGIRSTLQGFLGDLAPINNAAASASQSLTGLVAAGNFLGAAISGIVGGISVLVSGLFSIVAAAGQAAGALAALPGLLAAVGQGLGVAKLAFGGIGEAMKAGLKVTEAQAAATTASTGATGRLTAAQNRTAAAADAVRKAQERLNNARKEAAKHIKAVTEAANKASDAAAQAEIEQALASERRNAVFQNEASTAKERAAAEKAVEKAKQKTGEMQARETDAIEKAQKVREEGVNGNKKVIDAQKNLEKAQKRQEAAARAQQKASQAMAGAAGQLVKALQAQDQAMEKLTPNAQAFVNQLLAMRSTLKLFRDEAQENLFAGLVPALKTFNKGLLDTGVAAREGRKEIPSLLESVGETATVMGRAGNQFSKALFAGEGLRRLQTIFAENARTLGIFTKAGEDGTSTVTDLGEVITRLGVAIQPLTQRFARWIRDLFNSGTAADGLFGSTERLRDSFNKAGDVAAQLGRIIGNIAGAFSNLSDSAIPAGEGLLTSFENATQKFEDFTARIRDDGSAKKYFDDVADNLRDIGDLIAVVGGDFSSLADNRGIGALADSLQPASDNIRQIFDNFNSNGDVIGSFVTHLTEIALAFSDSSGIKVFFGTLDAIAGAVSTIVNLPGAKWVLGITGAIFAFRRAVNLTLGITNKLFAGLVGGSDETKKQLGGIGKSFDTLKEKAKGLGSRIKGIFTRKSGDGGSDDSGAGSGAPTPDPVPDLDGETSEARREGESIGNAIAQGVIRGLEEFYPRVIEAIDDIAEALIETLKTRLEIRSPSRVMDRLGEQAAEGFVNGLKGESDEAFRAGADLADSAEAGARSNPIAPVVAPAASGAMDIDMGLDDSIGGLDTFGKKLDDTEKKQGKFRGAMGKMGGAFKGLAGGMMGLVGGPMGLFMIALPLLIKAFQTLYDKSPGFRKFVDNLVKGFKSLVKAVTPIVKAIGQWLLGVLDKFFKWLNKNMPAIKNFFGSVFSAISGFVTGVLVPAFQKALPVIQVILSAISKAVGFAFTAIKFYIMNILIPYWQMVWKAIQIAWKIIQPILNLLWKAVQIAFTLIKGYITKIFIPVWRTVFSVVRQLFPVFQKVLSVVWGVVKRVFGAIKGTWEKVLRPVFNAIFSTVKSVFDRAGSVINGFKNGFDRVKNGIKSIVESIKSMFRGIRDTVGNVFGGLVDVIKKPIKAFANFINDKVIANVEKITSKFGLSNLPRINLGFAEGGYTGRGSKYQPAGIVHADEFVIKKASRRKIENKFPGLLNTMNKTGRVPVSKVGHGTGGIGDALSAVGGVLEDLAGGVWDGLKGVGKIAVNGVELIGDAAEYIAKNGLSKALVKILEGLEKLLTKTGIDGNGSFIEQFLFGGFQKLKDAAASWGSKNEPDEDGNYGGLLGAFTKGTQNMTAALGTGKWLAPLSKRFPINMGAGRHHNPSWAVDFGAPGGSRVQAASGGRILEAGWSRQGYGRFMRIGHANGVQTLYAHLGSLTAKAGEIVKAGQKIGLSGNTGNVKGPGGGYHLHFELLPGLDTLKELRKRGVKLAKGGVARATDGGIMSVIAEAGKAERVEPLDSDGFSKRDRAILDAIKDNKGHLTVNVYNPERERASESVSSVIRKKTSENGWQ